jgi:GAF domain-containing protein/GGDEF domain-containing protein
VVAALRVPLGEGISGRVAKEGRPMKISGPANPALTGATHVREDVAAALSVPMRAAAPQGEGAVIGVLNVSHRTDRDAFTDDDLAFLMRLASLEGQIISRSQEYARLKGVEARFDVYRELRERLDAEGPLPDRLDAVCRAVAARLPGGTCTVHRYDAGAELLVVEGTSQAGAGAPWARGARASLGQGLEGAVARDRRERRLVEADGGGVVLASPLASRDALEGVLVLTATDASEAGALALARELKAPLAEALRRDRERAATAGKATKLAAIAEAGLSILAATTPDELAKVVAASAAMVLEADAAVVRLRDDAGRFPILGAYGLPEAAADKRRRLEVERAAAGRASRERQGVREGNWLSAPLLVDGQVVGVVTVADKVADDPFRPGPFSPADQEILGRLAAYVEQTLKERLARAHTQGAGRGRVSDGQGATAAPDDRSVEASPRRAEFAAAEGEDPAAGARYVARRLADELARSRRNGRHVGVIVARVEPEGALAARDADVLDRLVASLGDLFRSRLRSYDEVVRVATTRLAVLLPDTEDGARAVADRLARAAHEDGVGATLAGAGARLAVGVAQAPDDLPPGPLKDHEGARALLERAGQDPGRDA